MQQQKILFQDKDVKITDKNITIKCYYFPIGTSKVIPIQSIIKIQVRDLGMARMRLWGMDAMAWGYWLPGDCKRCSRDQFIAIYTGKRIIPSFTTENTSIVYNILMSQLQKNKNLQGRNQNVTGVFINENSRHEQQSSMQRPIMYS